MKNESETAQSGVGKCRQNLRFKPMDNFSLRWMETPYTFPSPGLDLKFHRTKNQITFAVLKNEFLP